ncbi:MAG: hypothetical protein V8S34_01140 [Lawsonibacter sp.]
MAKTLLQAKGGDRGGQGGTCPSGAASPAAGAPRRASASSTTWSTSSPPSLNGPTVAVGYSSATTSANATFIAGVLVAPVHSTHFDKAMKVGASVVCARRGRVRLATFDELKNISPSPTCPSPPANTGLHPWPRPRRGPPGRGRGASRSCAPWPGT